ncbi:MAG: hypothetical protein AAB706_02195 [Patescibacteria group bacterium]
MQKIKFAIIMHLVVVLIGIVIAMIFMLGKASQFQSDFLLACYHWQEIKRNISLFELDNSLVEECEKNGVIIK